MSEAASSHVALAKNTRNSATNRGTVDGELLPSLVPLLHSWLPRQRWFAGKGRPVTGFSLARPPRCCRWTARRAPLLHLLVQADSPGDSGPAEDCYQLLVGVRASMPPTLASALIGRVERASSPAGPSTTRCTIRGWPICCWNVSADPAPSARCRFERGAPRFRRGSPPGCWTPNSPTPRWSTGTRTSSRSSDASSRAPTPTWSCRSPWPARGATGCRPPSAWFEAPGAGPLTLGVLQPFLHGARDGWRLALAALAAGRDFFLPEALALGRATAEVRTALAARCPPRRCAAPRPGSSSPG
ncbi:maltokinase [Streptomyces californicus]